MIVAHYGEPEGTQRLLASVRSATVTPDDVVVVDNQGNFSDDASTVVKPGRNLGFAGAAELGGQLALESGAEWLWYLNNDAVVDALCLERLLAVGSESRAGFLSPVILHNEGGNVWYAGGRINARSLAVTHEVDLPSDPRSTEFITGCALFARAAAVRHFGLPDASLFMYLEDVEWSLRAIQDNWQLVVVPSALVWHAVAMRNGRRVYSPEAIYYLLRNRLVLARRRGSLAWAIGPAIDVGVRQLVKAVGWSDGRRVGLCVVAGVVDGLLGRSGELPAWVKRRIQ